MSDFMSPNKYRREQLERSAQVRPSRLEKRLARAELAATDAIKANRAAGGSGILTAIYATLGVLGMLVALIPALLWIALVSVPGILLFMLFSQF